MQQSEADGIVIRLVPTVFRIVHDGYTIIVALVCQIGPIVSIHFVSIDLVVTSFYITDT